MNKSPFRQIELRYVSMTSAQTVPNLFTGVDREVMVPDGDQHIFEVGRDGSRKSRALCGITSSEIGEHITEHKERIPNRPVCANCSEKWKKHPGSPWAHWVKP